MYSRTVSCTCLFSPALNLKPSAEGLVEQQPGLELRDKARIATGVKRINPIMYSYPLARALTDPRPFIH